MKKEDTGPQISIQTQKQMHAFFMRTSAPRIYAKMMEEKKQNNTNFNNCNGKEAM